VGSIKSISKPEFAALLRETRIFGEVAVLAFYGLFDKALPNIRRHLRAVLVIPSFAARDLSLSPLGCILRELGYGIFIQAFGAI
jgi:hypothetical protein